MRCESGSAMTRLNLECTIVSELKCSETISCAYYNFQILMLVVGYMGLAKCLSVLIIFKFEFQIQVQMQNFECSAIKIDRGPVYSFCFYKSSPN